MLKNTVYWSQFLKHLLDKNVQKCNAISLDACFKLGTHACDIEVLKKFTFK